MKLSQDKIHSVLVNASATWNDTSIDVAPGECYALSARGHWVDWYIPSGPDGFDSFLPSGRLVEQFRRHPEAPWFALIGCVNKQSTNQFVIGSGTHFEPETDGRLYVFANDVEGCYWNNRGDIELKIIREA